MIFSEFFKAIKNKRSKSRAGISYSEPVAAFCDTAEGCFLFGWDQNHETYRAVLKVYKTLPSQTKHALAFSPEDGFLVERAQFWRTVLKPSLPPALYHGAMRAIYACYKRVKG